MTDFVQWEGFQGRIWKEEVNTRDFIQKNYRPYSGDESFLAGPTEATDKLWGALQVLQKEERAKGGEGADFFCFVVGLRAGAATALRLTFWVPRPGCGR